MAPVAAPLAGQGYVMMQYEFSPGEALGIRQFSLIYRAETSDRNVFRSVDAAPSRVTVRLFSLDRSRPGLFNLPMPDYTRLQSSAGGSDKSEQRRKTIQAVTVLSLIGLGTY